MKLSEKLKRYRTDRPDEWTMDEFARQAKQLEDWLQWCMDNCDDSPEYNFGTDATEILNRLLKGESVYLPDTLQNAASAAILNCCDQLTK